MEFLNFLREEPVMAWLVFLGRCTGGSRALAQNVQAQFGRCGKAAGASYQTGPFWQSDGTDPGVFRNFVAAGLHRLDQQYSPSLVDVHRHAGEQT
jgi:hypothetical protein